jgi:hypothetical protein
MDVVLHYEDEYLFDWLYEKVSPGASRRAAPAGSLLSPHPPPAYIACA